MSNDLKITINRIEESCCDLSGKTTECVVCTMADGMDSVIAVNRFTELLRFVQAKQNRKNGNDSSTKKTTSGAIAGSSE